MAKRARSRRKRVDPNYPRRTSKDYVNAERKVEGFSNMLTNKLLEMIELRLVPAIEGLAGSQTDSFDRPLISKLTDAPEGDYLERIIDLIEAQYLGRFSRSFIRANLNSVFSELQIDVDNDIIQEFSQSQIPITPSPTQRTVVEETVREATQSITNLQQETLRNVRTEIIRGLNQGVRWEEIARRIRSDVSKADEPSTPIEKARNRARFVARNTVSTALGKINEESQTSAGVELYVWQTAEDERVRATHRDLDGKIFSWNPAGETVEGVSYEPARDPGYNGGSPTIPGQPWNCRCVAIPYVPELENL